MIYLVIGHWNHLDTAKQASLPCLYTPLFPHTPLLQTPEQQVQFLRLQAEGFGKLEECLLKLQVRSAGSDGGGDFGNCTAAKHMLQDVAVNNGKVQVADIPQQVRGFFPS